MPIHSSTYLYPKTYDIWIDALDSNYSVPRSIAAYHLTRLDGSMITPVPTPTPFPCWLAIDPVLDQTPGSVFTISGTTNLPVGSTLLFEHHRAVDPHLPPDTGNLSELIVVAEGDGTDNIWQYTIDSSDFPDSRAYRIGVSAEYASPASTSYFLVHPGDIPALIMPMPTPTYD